MRNNSPFVNIFVPSYNTRETIGELISSLLRQTYRDIKIIVLDNASTDGTADVARAHASRDGRVEVIVNPENIGGPGNYAKVVGMCGGDFTAIVGSDDVYEPDFIEREVRFLQKTQEAAAVFSEALEIDGKGAVVGVRRTPAALPEKPVYSLEDILRAILSSGNFLICPTVMVRTAVLRAEIHPLDPVPYKTSTDLAIWLKILERHRIGIIREPLVRYRLSRHSFTYNYVRMRVSRHDMFLVLDHYLEKYADTILGPGDRRNYRLLQEKDKLNIAVNCLIMDERSRARAFLLDGPLRVSLLPGVLRTPWFYKYFAMAAVAFLLTLVPLPALCRRVIHKVRHG